MKIQIASGIELFVVDQGQGEPIVLVHGFPLHHGMWLDQIDVLSRQYRVIAPDLRGFGKSDVTEGTVTMERFADDIAELLDSLEIDEPATVCGLSMGGYVTFAFWRKYARRVKTLILCDTRAAADPPLTVKMRHQAAESVLQEGVTTLVDGMIPKLFSEPSKRERLHLIDRLREMAVESDPRGIAAANRGMAQRPDSTGMLHEIDCPALVLVGEEDAISPPEEMVSICRAIPHGRFVEIPRAGHMSPMENPAEVNGAILEFLASL